MKTGNIILKALNGERVSKEEALYLYTEAPLALLMNAAHKIRNSKKEQDVVTWLIDMNVNLTNVCASGCLFCNFYVGKSNNKAYITTLEEYEAKMKLLFEKGGDQVLLQGGLHPGLGLDFYRNLFKQLKRIQPAIKLHALGPPEIVHISKMEGISYKECLIELVKSGLDSLPGAGAEILMDRVRNKISKNKCSSQEWLDVMRCAHDLSMITSATMMFGHIETSEERIMHLEKLRIVQDEKPPGQTGFIAFIPWPFQSKNTALAKKYPGHYKTSPEEYIRLIAISRIMLDNIDNIQPSWLTVGTKTAQACLYAGGNDFGSIMIEEKVVSSAGANHRLNKEQMENVIKEAGFVPRQRNQAYRYVD